MSKLNSINFPLFRKYANGNTYFRVNAYDNFDELKIMGNNYSLKNYKATILPDRNYIIDLINNEGEHWKIIDEVEFNQTLASCEEKMQKVDWL